MKRQPATSAAPASKPKAKPKPKAKSKPTPKPTSKPASSTTARAQPVPLPVPDLYSSIHALLHTMRLIEQHEEALCSMHDEMKRTGKLSAPHRRKLHLLVHDLPADDYQADLQALRYALAAQNL